MWLPKYMNTLGACFAQDAKLRISHASCVFFCNHAPHIPLPIFVGMNSRDPHVTFRIVSLAEPSPPNLCASDKNLVERHVNKLDHVANSTHY